MGLLNSEGKRGCSMKRMAIVALVTLGLSIPAFG